tara:strand:+ start:547 stop:735 length:189 start_codon:yes stop_codon:yes gene_type:complete
MKKFKSIALYSSKEDKKILNIASQLFEIFSNVGVKVLVPNSSKEITKNSIRTYSDKYIIDKS